MTDRDERTIVKLADVDKDTLTVFKDTIALTSIRGLMLVINDKGEAPAPGENAILLDEASVRQLTVAMLAWLHTGDRS